ncbi:hypothetical protein CBW22_21595 [Pantoea sp. VS1]|nr:hypothetical protein CBW22_21595 [Pantoea sp. VS1]
MDEKGSKLRGVSISILHQNQQRRDYRCLPSITGEGMASCTRIVSFLRLILISFANEKGIKKSGIRLMILLAEV